MKKHSLDRAQEIARQYFKDRYEYRGRLGVEQKHPDYIIFFTRDDAKIEEGFRVELKK